MFKITAKDNLTQARLGVLQLPRGEIQTPVFMPVGTNGTVRAILHNHLKEIGYKLILGNTYHLYLRPGMEVIRKFGGLHAFSSWEGSILTDSGGFQVFSLPGHRKITPEGVRFQSPIDGSRHELTPEKAVEIQTLLGSDIQMVLDHCTGPEISRKEALEALNTTSDWAGRAKKRWEGGPEGYQGALFGIVQGNFYKDLREQSARELVDMDFPGYAIGGLSVGEEPGVFKDFLHFTAPLLPQDKPKYVMGIGTPDYMLEAIEAGIDMFDCVFPTRVARNGTCFTRQGLLNLKNARFRDDTSPLEENCPCPACREYSRGYLRHLFTAKEILGPMLTTWHNLQFLFSLMEEAREAVRTGTFSSYKKSFLENFRKSP